MLLGASMLGRFPRKYLSWDQNKDQPMRLSVATLSSEVGNPVLVDRLKDLIEGHAAKGASSPLSGFVQGLPEFLTPITQTIDALTESTVTKVRVRLADALPRYSPRLYEGMLSEAAELLNRCESYRSEANEAARRAIDQSFELVTRDALRANQRSLLEKTAKDAHDDRVTGYQKASDAFDKSTEALAKGNAALALTESKFAKAVNVVEDDRKTLYKFALEIDEEYDAAVKLQQTLPGGALNEVEHYKRVTRFFAEDLAEAYERLMAAHIGLTQFTALSDWSHDRALPNSGEQLFDDLIHWVRRAMREVDVASLNDQEVVVQLAARKTSVHPNLLADDFSGFNPGGSGEVVFHLDASHLPKGFTDFRLISIGLCFQNGDTFIVNRADMGIFLPLYATLTVPATVDVPEQKFTSVNGNILMEPAAKLSIGSIGPVNAAGTYLEVGGPRLTYASPIGQWKVTLGLPGITAETVTDWRGRIDGLVLYLRLIGRTI